MPDKSPNYSLLRRLLPRKTSYIPPSRRAAEHGFTTDEILDAYNNGSQDVPEAQYYTTDDLKNEAKSFLRALPLQMKLVGLTGLLLVGALCGNPFIKMLIKGETQPNTNGKNALDVPPPTQTVTATEVPGPQPTENPIATFLPSTATPRQQASGSLSAQKPEETICVTISSDPALPNTLGEAAQQLGVPVPEAVDAVRAAGGNPDLVFTGQQVCATGGDADTLRVLPQGMANPNGSGLPQAGLFGSIGGAEAQDSPDDGVPFLPKAGLIALVAGIVGSGIYLAKTDPKPNAN